MQDGPCWRRGGARSCGLLWGHHWKEHGLIGQIVFGAHKDAPAPRRSVDGEGSGTGPQRREVRNLGICRAASMHTRLASRCEQAQGQSSLFEGPRGSSTTWGDALLAGSCTRKLRTARPRRRRVGWEHGVERPGWGKGLGDRRLVDAEALECPQVPERALQFVSPTTAFACGPPRSAG